MTWIDDLRQRSSQIVGDSQASYVVCPKSNNGGNGNNKNKSSNNSPRGEVVVCENLKVEANELPLDAEANFELAQINDFKPNGGILWSVTVSSPEDGLIAVAGQRRTIDVFKCIDGKFLPYCSIDLSEPFEKTIRYVEFAPKRVQGLLLLACCSFDSTCYIMSHEPHENVEQDMRAGKKLDPAKIEFCEWCFLNGHESEVKSIRFSPCCNFVATCGRDKACFVYSLVNAPDDAYVVAVLQEHTQDVKHLAWRPSLCDYVTGEKMVDLPSIYQNVENEIPQLMTVSFDNTIRVWEPLPGSGGDHWDKSQVLDVHTDIVWHIAFSKCGNRFASASQDRTIAVWRWKSGLAGLSKSSKGRASTARDFYAPKDMNGNLGMVVSPDIAVSGILGSLENIVGWNQPSAELTKLSQQQVAKFMRESKDLRQDAHGYWSLDFQIDPIFHPQPIYAVDFCGDTLVSGCGDNNVRFFQVKKMPRIPKTNCLPQRTAVPPAASACCGGGGSSHGHDHGHSVHDHEHSHGGCCSREHPSASSTAVPDLPEPEAEEKAASPLSATIRSVFNTLSDFAVQIGRSKETRMPVAIREEVEFTDLKKLEGLVSLHPDVIKTSKSKNVNLSAWNDSWYDNRLSETLVASGSHILGNDTLEGAKIVTSSKTLSDKAKNYRLLHVQTSHEDDVHAVKSFQLKDHNFVISVGEDERVIVSDVRILNRLQIL